MSKKWFTYLNYAIAGCTGLFILAAVYLEFARYSEISVVDAASIKTSPPKNAFAQPKEAYERIGEPLLGLKFSSHSMMLPDLKKHLVYYGKNGRPDAHSDIPLLHFAFTGNKAPTSIKPGEKLYLSYDKKLTPPQYIFSANNEETPLWIEAASNGSEVLVKVFMKSSSDEILHSPPSNAQFPLPEKEYVRFGNVPWEIGKLRVDGSLLARQKTRWYGPDRFLEKHGGNEYSTFLGKQRLDFGEGDDVYSVYVGIGDALVWDNDRWVVVKPGPDSLGHPLLVVKKVDERLINFELWDVDGKAKVVLNLLKSNENWTFQNIQQNFKFVGARTRSQFVFEINKERMLLSPHDWLVLTTEGWRKLSSSEEIDDYVNRKLTGTLFVFDGVSRKDDRQVLLGTIFNPSRTDMQPIEIPVHQGSANPGAIEHPKEADQKKNLNSPAVPYAKIKQNYDMISEES